MDTPLSEAAQNVARRLKRAALPPLWITCALLLIDLPLFTLALWFGQYAGHPAGVFHPWAALGWAGLGGLIGVVLLLTTGSYAPTVTRHMTAATCRAVIALVGPACVALISIAPDHAPMVVPTTALACLIAIIPLRLGTAVVTRWIAEAGLSQTRAVIAGGGANAEHLVRGLTGCDTSHIHLYGLFDDRDDIRSPLQVLGIPKLGGYADLMGFVRETDIDMVIIALPLEAEARINWLLDAFRVLPVEIRLSAFEQDYTFKQDRRDPLIAAIQRSFAPERRLTKRAFDICFASIALLLLSPIMLAAALAVRLDSPGPVLFRQARHGYNDQIIQIFKFRSMYADRSDPEGRDVVTRDDPRVTRVGRWLRRSSLDELPQLFNVLRGDLSMVGPRPHAVDARSSGSERFSAIIDGYSARHRLPPGITGWAQVNGWRGEIDDPTKLKSRFEHDLYYIDNWSLWLDLKILLDTPRALLRSEGAY